MTLNAAAPCLNSTRGFRCDQYIHKNPVPTLMGNRTRVHLIASRVHKWLALIIGAQLLIWFASGVIMSFLPIEKVRGEHLVDRDRIVAIPADAELLSPSALAARAAAPVNSVTVHMLDNRPVAELVTNKGIKLFDAVTGAALPPVDAALATKIARAAWTSPQPPRATATMVTVATTEYRAALPAWRIAFADAHNTSVFVAVDTGKITAVRNGTWRLYDFFWGLHIMDWKNHEDFNSWWLLGFAIGGLVLGIAGTVLLIMRWPFRRKRRLMRRLA
ncbi:MAG: PepSY domain-containing protein [Blastomonas fulva]|uniref:PepSY domain-containing protein n=1 Tax=Blastomonas fulva TaxID=1550728 RepID=UPI004034B81B